MGFFLRSCNRHRFFSLQMKEILTNNGLNNELSHTTRGLETQARTGIAASLYNQEFIFLPYFHFVTLSYWLLSLCLSPLCLSCPNGEGLYEVQGIIRGKSSINVTKYISPWLQVHRNPPKLGQGRKRICWLDVSISHGPKDRKYS